MGFKKLTDGTIAYGPSLFLNMYDDLIKNQLQFENTVKFKTNSTVEVIASLKELTDYFLQSESSYISAKNHALIILGNKTGTVLGCNNFDEGIFYTIEFETEPMCLLPEKFLKNF